MNIKDIKTELKKVPEILGLIRQTEEKLNAIQAEIKNFSSITSLADEVNDALKSLIRANKTTHHLVYCEKLKIFSSLAQLAFVLEVHEFTVYDKEGEKIVGRFESVYKIFFSHYIEM